MRSTIAILTLLLLPAVAHAQPRSRHGGTGRGVEPWPIQLNVAGGANYYDDGRPETPGTVGFGALWIGGVIPMDPFQRARSSGFFVGPGVEGTIDGMNGPYEWSAGGGMRMGYVWRGFLQAPVPDGYVYMRVTPFFGMRTIADEEYLGDHPAVSRRGGGVRVGVGVTSPAWTAFMAGGILESGSGAHFHDPAEALACCLLGLALMLVNHGELTWEIYSEPGATAITRVGFRIGTGF